MNMKKIPCPRCRKNGGDVHGDNFVFYGEGKGGFCFSCGYTELSDDEKEKRGITTGGDWLGDEMTRDALTKEEVGNIKQNTGTQSYGHRGITDKAHSHFYNRFSYTKEGDLYEHYYPVFSKEGTLTGFKVRKLPKDFRVEGLLNNDSLLYGQLRHMNSNSKKVVICAGEVDAVSMHQVISEYYQSKGSEQEDIPVVSPCVGESGAWKQIKNHYEWFNRFEQIIVCFDNDDAGKKAVNDLVKVLPKGKMFVMAIPDKDINDMLQAEKTARNISKNTTIIIPAHNIPSFKPAKTFVSVVK